MNWAKVYVTSVRANRTQFGKRRTIGLIRLR